MHGSPNLSVGALAPRGLTYAVLRLVSLLGKRAYGAEIREHLSQQTGSDVPAANVYVMLRRLEDYGLITAADQGDLSTAGRKGRPRRIYQVTAPGQRALMAGAKLYAYPVLHNEELLYAQSSSAQVG